MPSSLYIPFLLAGMILTGSSNSLWSKWQDMQCVENCADPNPAKHVLYEQPVWQTLQMFLGEMLCVSLVGLSGSLIKDAVKDAFVGNVVPSLANSRRALASVSAEEPEASKVLVGVFFILFAQIFTATQFVVEEKIMGRYSVAPLVAVGWEGFFGAITILFFFPILSIPSIAEKSTFFDLPRGWYQMINTPTVLYSGIAIAFSIALFNYFGLSDLVHLDHQLRPWLGEIHLAYIPSSSTWLLFACIRYSLLPAFQALLPRQKTSHARLQKKSKGFSLPRLMKPQHSHATQSIFSSERQTLLHGHGFGIIGLDPIRCIDGA
ncbi:hypothetical protein ONZ45_g18193 [Pleurotus djamor]|nr:hypothetical protein ONZ45_g18193 [Pleurotus djamor]